MTAAIPESRCAVSRGAFILALVVYLPLRIFMTTLPGGAGDAESYRDWAMGSAYYGFSRAYNRTTIDYPPALLYVLYPIGLAYLHLHPEIATATFERTPWGEYFVRTLDGHAYRSWTSNRRHLPQPGLRAGPLPDLPIFQSAVKLPFLFFDLALAALLYWLVARGSWGDAQDSRSARSGSDSNSGWGRLAALAYLFNPIVLWGSGYWAQADSVHSVLVLASLAALAKNRLVFAGMFLATAGLMKPLAAPFVPLLVFFVAARYRVAGVIRSGIGGVAAAIAIFLPFFLAGHGARTLRAVLLDVDRMPFQSVNGHSMWWLLGGWQRADEPVLGALSATHVGLALFLAAYAALLWRSRSWMRGPEIDGNRLAAQLCLLAAAVAASFFFFSTHMHENHLFIVIPLLLCVAGRSRALAGLTVAASAVCFVNMALHDHDLPQLLPGLLSDASSHRDGISGRMLTHAQWLGSNVNAVAAGAVMLGIYHQAWRLCVGDTEN